METLANRYGRWLEWLRRSQPVALEEQPPARVTLRRLQAWLEALAHTAPMTRFMFVDGLLRVVTAVAPDTDWSGHRRVRAPPQAHRRAG
jgi:integrase/recombinase XerD